MYQHADQSWKNKPLILSERHQELLVERLEEYIAEKRLERILVIFHGGEPLIFGAEKLIELSKKIQNRLFSLKCRVDFGIQTNGLLLTESLLEKLEKNKITVSLSIDGPKEIHDQHRLDHRGKSSFDRVYQALLMLKKFPAVFSGCLAVINPNFEPHQLFEFFHHLGVNDIDILLPDANYLSPPKGREENPDLYKNWLIKAFDCWFDEFPHINCRFFESIMMGILGHHGQTDAFGFGDVSMLNIETDGSYHDLDVLKITKENYSSLGLNLENNPIIEAEKSEQIQTHRKLLTIEGLSEKCRECKHVNICGGGSVPHRFSAEGFKNPTIYCHEIYSLIDHLIGRFAQEVEKVNQKKGKTVLYAFNNTQMRAFWDSHESGPLLSHLQNHLAQKNFTTFKSILKRSGKAFPHKLEVIDKCQELTFEQLKSPLLKPTTHAWLRAMEGFGINSPALNIDEQELPSDPDYFDDILLLNSKPDSHNFVIQDSNRWYHLSLGKNIVLQHSPEDYQNGLNVLSEALEIIEEHYPALYDEMLQISRHIQLVKDITAHPDKDVSFSDETMPGAIFVSVWKSDGLLSPYQIAASLIHEHLHQKLYLLQQSFDLFTPQQTLIFSPWPQKDRPPSGALHAIYVFTHVALFWRKMLDLGHVSQLAQQELDFHLPRLDQCINDVKANVHFTLTGQLFFDCLLNDYGKLLEISLQNRV